MSLLLSAIAVGSAAQFTSGVSLVEVYATVTTADGTVLTGLPRSAFTVSENGTEQEVAAFASGDIPLALAIGVDRSFSISTTRLNDVRAAVGRFLTALRAADETLLLGIGSQPDVLAPLGASRQDTLRALDGVVSWGSTPLHDSIISAIDAIAGARGRRALILISDGADRYSTHTADEVQRYARSHDVILYPIAGRIPAQLLSELAAVTGGRAFQAADRRAMDMALSAIAGELRAQYLLGYVPKVPAAEGAPWRSINVRVNVGGARVRARDGYQAR